MIRAAQPVRTATRADLDALVELEFATFETDRISRRQWRRHITSASVSVLVAGTSGRVDAAAVVFHRRGSQRARLYSIAVAAAARGHGIARALLAAAEADSVRRGCTALDLEVRIDNIAAIALYEGHGYRRVARLPGFYEGGGDAWRYTKAIANP